MEQWRLIPWLEGPGAMQMALDEWLLEQHRLGLMPSVLRFYTWSPSAISLGYHQHQYPQEWNTLTWRGKSIDIVRRPTGGRAVLHQGDLTYAVITSSETLNGIKRTMVERPTSSVTDSTGHSSNPARRSQRTYDYRAICQFLIDGFRSFGVTLDYGTAGRGYIHNPNCFGTATAADLILPDGTKLIGSAQLRRGKAILQHGSIRITPDPHLFRQVFGEDTAVPSPDMWTNISSSLVSTSASGEPRDATVGLSTHQPIEADLSPLQHSLLEQLTKAACTCFQIEERLVPLSDEEWKNAVALSHRWQG